VEKQKLEGRIITVDQLGKQLQDSLHDERQKVAGQQLTIERLLQHSQHLQLQLKRLTTDRTVKHRGQSSSVQSRDLPPARESSFVNTSVPQPRLITGCVVIQCRNVDLRALIVNLD